MKRLEVWTDNLGDAEDQLRIGRSEQISDVQRFGDRLDVMARDAEQGRVAIEERTRSRRHLTLREFTSVSQRSKTRLSQGCAP